MEVEVFRLTPEEGKTYEFVNDSNKDFHPFNLKDNNNNIVVINNNTGTIKLTATSSEAPYKYFCGNHDIMSGLMQVNTLTQPTITQPTTTQPTITQAPTTQATITQAPTTSPTPIIALQTIPVSTFPEKMTGDQYNQILDLQISIKKKIE